MENVPQIIHPSSKVKWSHNNIITLSDKGCSTRLWGIWFWQFMLSLAANITNLFDFHPHWISFIFRRSFGSTGPCEHCCNSHRQFVYRSELDLDRLILIPQSTAKNNNQNGDILQVLLVRWLISLKNYVNTKLDKQIPNMELMEFALWRDIHFTEIWSYYLFNWLYCQALMFPVDVSVSARLKNVKLSRKYRDFVYLFTQVRYLLPKVHPLSQRFNRAYIRCSPCQRDFSSREHLFCWLYKLHTICIGRPLNYSVQELGHMFEKLRSKSCSNAKNVCE